MASKQKLQLRKDLDKFHAPVRAWKRPDLTSGRWFVTFIERQMASHLGGRQPPDLEEAFPDADSEDERAEEVATEAIHQAIAATDAYIESLTGTEVRNLKEKRLDLPDTHTKLTGDAVALIAELLFVIDRYLTLLFEVTSCHKKVFAGGDADLVAEVFGRALGNVDVDQARQDGKLGLEVGAKIYDRAIVQTIDNKVADALRKGFYCYLGKALARTVTDYLDRFDPWAAPQPLTGEMLSVDPTAAAAGGDDGMGFET